MNNKTMLSQLHDSFLTSAKAFERIKGAPFSRTQKPLNNKRRKLQFIRQKNALRKGAILRGHFIISKELIQDSDFLQSQINEAVDKIGKKYKTPCKVYAVNVGHNRDDADTLSLKYTVIAESHAEL